MCCSERAYPLFRGNNHVETRTSENKLKLEPDGGHIFRSWNDFRKWLAVYCRQNSVQQVPQVEQTMF